MKVCSVWVFSFVVESSLEKMHMRKVHVSTVFSIFGSCIESSHQSSYLSLSCECVFLASCVTVFVELVNAVSSIYFKMIIITINFTVETLLFSLVS